MTLSTVVSRVTHRPRGVVSIAVGLAAVGLALSTIGSGASASTIAQPGQPVPREAVVRLDAIAARAAKSDGDSAPVWKSAVVTTHAKALESATPGDTEPEFAGTVVYLITIKGHFTAYLASVPSGAKLPTGSYLSIVVNARTFQVMDWGLSPKSPPVAPGSLGPVTALR